MSHISRKESLPDPTLLFGSLLIALGFLVGGCTALQPFPNAARAGDTVMLAVGSPDGMTRSNTTAQYVPDSDPFNPVDLTAKIRSIFKIYPDRTSGPWLTNGLTNLVVGDTAHGPWLTVMAIDLPSFLLPDTGVVQVTSSATIGSLATPINGLDIPIEILPGAGAPSEFLYDASSVTRTGDLLALEPLKQVVVRPPSGGATSTYGAVEVKLNLPLINLDGTSAPDTGYSVVVDDMGLPHLRSQLQTSWARNGDEITVMIISPTGAMSSWLARFSVVVFEQPRVLLGMPGTIIDTSKPSPSLTSIRYFDIDGFEVTGPSPTVTVEGG